MKIRKGSKRPVRASRRAIKASSDSYWKVWMSYATEDGSPAELKGTAIEEVFDRAMPYDKEYYRGRTYFTEKFFDNEADARAYKAKFDRYIGVNFAEIESSRTVSCSAKRTVRASASGAKYAPIIGRDLDWFENDVEKYVGKKATTIRKFLEGQDFVLDEMSGPARDSAWESWRLDTEAGNIQVIFYFDLIPVKGSNKLNEGKITKAYVEDNQDAGTIRDEEARLFSSKKVSCSVKTSKIKKAVKASIAVKAAWSSNDAHMSMLDVIYKKKNKYINEFKANYDGDPNTSWDNIFDGAVDEFWRFCDDEASADESGKTISERFDAGEITAEDVDSEFDGWVMWVDINDFDYGDIDASVKASIGAKRKAIMAGAGSGITLELNDLTFTEIPDGGFYNEFDDYHDFLEPENGYCKGTIDIASIGTYYDGGDPGIGEIPVDIQVVAVYPDDGDIAQEMIGESLKEAVDGINDMEKKIYIGGGWTRSSFTGEFETDAYSYDATFKLKIKITDDGLAQWLDAFAHGESEELFYDIAINDNPNGNYYESLEDAIETAKEYAADPQYADDEITVVIEHYNTDYNGEIVGYFDDNGDVVWNSNDALYE